MKKTMKAANNIIKGFARKLNKNTRLWRVYQVAEYAIDTIAIVVCWALFPITAIIMSDSAPCVIVALVWSLAFLAVAAVPFGLFAIEDAIYSAKIENAWWGE